MAPLDKAGRIPFCAGFLIVASWEEHHSEEGVVLGQAGEVMVGKSAPSFKQMDHQSGEDVGEWWVENPRLAILCGMSDFPTRTALRSEQSGLTSGQRDREQGVASTLAVSAQMHGGLAQ